MCLFCLHVYLCPVCVPSACRGQKGLETVVSHVGAGNRTQVLCESSKFP